GSAYMSSLISELRDPLPPMEKYRAETKRSLEYLAGLTARFETLFDQINPGKVYFFNGRFSIYRPLLRVCQLRGVPVGVHERGPNHVMYSVTEGNMPHDIPTKLKEMDKAWNDSAVSLEEKTKIGADWYEKRARGIMTAWRSFTDYQRAELMPSGWSDSN